MRIVITGYPNSGKSTLASMLMLATGAADIKSTDKLIDTHNWSELSEEVSDWLDHPGPWIIEGVACARALRKWRKRHGYDCIPPFDMFIYTRRRFANYRPGQRAMANGLDTVMCELWRWITESHVTVFELGGMDES